MKYRQEYLDKELKTYGASDIYPFHMPGHKRQNMEMEHPERMDITEVEGFDNLHHAQGIIAKAQARMARVFGAQRSFFLVNGSTSGLLAAISATVPKGGKILIARNCHKAVYNAIYLRELSVEYVYPMQTAWGIQGSIDPENVRNKLSQDPQIQAVLLTSPTYDGVVSDIETIAEIVHAHNIPLIVDEAHGAHFGFSAGFPKKAHACGADLVIESMHKTLPAYTQSAALHVGGDRIDVDRLQKFLGIYQSSSPSYLLMAGLDRCVRILEEEGAERFAAYEKRLARFYQEMKGLKHLHVLSPNQIETSELPKESVLPEDSGSSSVVQDRHAAGGIWDRDLSKILIFCGQHIRRNLPMTGSVGGEAGMSGNKLASILLKEYGLQVEMDSGHYVTALTSLMDTEEGFARLAAALKEIDASVEPIVDLVSAAKADDMQAESIMSKLAEGAWCKMIDILYQPKEKQMEIAAATEAPCEMIAFAQAADRISVEFAYLYPPGIPFLTPGEQIPENLPEVVTALLAEGFEIQGLEDLSGQRIKVASR